MIFCVFLTAGLLAAGLYAALAAAVTVWGLLGVFVLGYLAANLLFVLVFGVNGLLLPRLKPGEGIEKQHGLSRWFCAAIPEMLNGYFGVRAQIKGLDKLPDGPFLYVSNHRSGFDPLLVMDKLRKYNICFVSKPSNLELPIIGSTARHAGYLAIDRENNREALKTILQAADYLRRGMCSIGIYPEGTRSKTGELLPFHAGSFKIAQRAGVPVAVACVRGTEAVMKGFPFRRKTVRLDILELIDAERAKAMPTVELAEEARRLIQAKLDEEKSEK